MRIFQMVKDKISSQEMRTIETNAEYFGISLLQLMETAGRNVAEEIASRFQPKKTKVTIICGTGGNGGDGFVTARYLRCLGFKVDIILASLISRIRSKIAQKNLEALLPFKDTISIKEITDSEFIPKIKADVIVDALLGIGLSGSVRSPIKQFIKTINEAEAYRVAIDIPSGIDSDTGEVLGIATKANLTVTFHKEKIGFANAKEYTGELVVKNIGLPFEIEKFVGPGDVKSVVKQRLTESHKGDFGRVLVIGGSETFSGAPALVAQAALRTGVDLVYVAAPEKTAHAISSLSPDLITIKLAGSHLKPKNIAELEDYVKFADCVVLGPGLGLHPKTKETVETLIETVDRIGKPLLLDADGLKAFAEFKRKTDVPLVLTPHAKEYTLLTARNLQGTLREKVLDVQRTATDLNAVVMLKGPIDIISVGRRTKMNFTGNPGMTVGGTGDVLSGIIGALLAKEVEPFQAAVVGAFVNGAAGDFVFEEKGPHMVSTDLINWIPHVFNDPMSHLRMHIADAKKG